MCVWSNRFILSVDQHPQSDLIFGILEVLSDAALECTVRLRFQDAEAWEVGRWPVLLVKGRKIEAFMMCKSVIRDDLGSQEKVLLFALFFLGFKLKSFLVKAALCEVSSKSV